MNEPDEILHIAIPDEWQAARATGSYRVSTRGKTLDEVGFIHCSYPRQVVRVANFAYGDLAELVILHLDAEMLEAEIKLEPAADNGRELYPHIYGPIPTAAVIAETWWDRGDDGLWHLPAIW